MASPLLPTVPNSPLIDRNNVSEYARLPNGPCNYTSLSAGIRCGCRRFWDKANGASNIPGNGPSLAGICHCDHHACFHFHDHERSPQKGRILSDASATGSVTRKAPVNPDSLTPRADVQERVASPDLDQMIDANLPDTLHWSRYMNSGESLGSLPAIPSQCLLPSDTSRASSQARYTRPFGGLGLDTLSHIPKPKSTSQNVPQTGKDADHIMVDGKRMSIYQNRNGEQCLQSVTEALTPILQASQDLGFQALPDDVSSGQNPVEFDASAHQIGLPTCPSDDLAAHEPGGPNQLAIISDPVDNFIPRLRSLVEDYPVMKQNHGQRLEVLENGSFVNPALEDLQDNYNHLDTRVLEVETKLGEIEKANNDVSSIVTSINDSQISKTSSALMTSAMDRSEFNSRFEALEAHISDLHSVSPSMSHPWEVDVVLLPFGANLSGIWSQDHGTTQNRSRHNSMATDDWTQTQQNSLAAQQAFLITQEYASAWQETASDVGRRGAAWLVPRACRSRSRVEQRLRSRGLVKTVHVKGPDAKDVQVAIMSAFGNLPAILIDDPFSEHDHTPFGLWAQLKGYHGLHAPWIPLRKLHKDSCLRFLDASEMVTPALWTVSFLSSSVAMRQKGHRTLFITQPDSYVQHCETRVADWTWQKLRRLDRVYPDSQASNHTPEADAHEECWEWDSRLDPPPSLHSSFASVMSLRSPRAQLVVPTSPSDHFSSAAVSRKGTDTPRSTPQPPARPVSSLKERHPFRTIHRTVSMPTNIPLKGTPSQIGKRSVASFERESHSSPFGLVLNQKRRRTRSPSRPLDTPRWSIGPPSPSVVHDTGRSGNTPFAYATPFSNVPHVEASHPQSGVAVHDEHGSTTDEFNMDEGFDQAALSDYDSQSSSISAQTRHPDEEWHGVEDESEACESRTLSHGMSMDIIRLKQEDENESDQESDASDESDVSSVPSEYPSTQQPAALYASGRGGVFRIHVDEEI